jgi:hypothetical protein
MERSSPARGRTHHALVVARRAFPLKAPRLGELWERESIFQVFAAFLHVFTWIHTLLGGVGTLCTPLVECGENVRTPHGIARVGHRVDRERGALQPFSLGPPPNRTCSFHCIRLSDDLFLSLPSERTSCMDTSMAFVAYYQGFPPSHRHDVYP